MKKERLLELAGIIIESDQPQKVYPGDLDGVIEHFVEQDRALPIYISGYYDDSMLLVSTKPFDPKRFA